MDITEDHQQPLLIAPCDSAATARAPQPHKRSRKRAWDRMSPEQADHIKNMRYEIGGDAGSNLKNRLQSHRKTFRSGRKFAPDEPMFQLTSRPSNPGEFCVHLVGICAPHLMFRDVDRMPCPFCPENICTDAVHFKDCK